MEEARAAHGFHLWVWVIMPEHIHLLWWPPFDLISADPANRQGRVCGILTSLKRPMAVWAIAWPQVDAPDFLQQLTVVNANRTDRHFWQTGSGFDENVSDAASLQAIIESIHLNPVRRGLVKRPEDWPWSSARDWMQLPNSLLKVDRTLSQRRFMTQVIA